MNININALKNMRKTDFIITVTDKNYKKKHMVWLNAF